MKCSMCSNDASIARATKVSGYAIVEWTYFCVRCNKSIDKQETIKPKRKWWQI